MKHHSRKYKGKMPLWVMVEMMSLSDVSKLYSCMYISEQKAIADVVGCGTKTLKNHLHCISVLRNKCAHAARLYGETLYPSVSLSKYFLRSYSDVHIDSLFAYLIVLLKHLPCKDQKNSLLKDLELLISKYEDYIGIDNLGFPQNWMRIAEKQCR